MPNAELLRETMAYIEQHPEQWDQKVWRRVETGCGTTACFAGWALELSDHKFGRATDWWGSIRDFSLVTVAGERVQLPAAAASVLGLSDEQAEILFDARNSMNDLRALVHQLADDGDFDEDVYEDREPW